MTHVTCRLTAKNRDQLGTLRSLIEYGAAAADGPARGAASHRTSMGVYLVSSRVLSCNYDLKEKSFYRAFNAIFGKVGRVASADVVVEC